MEFKFLIIFVSYSFSLYAKKEKRKNSKEMKSLKIKNSKEIKSLKIKNSYLFY